MIESPAPAPATPEYAELLARLVQHRTIGDAPQEELEWLIRHGTLQRYEAGELIARSGEYLTGLFVILEGRVGHFRDTGGALRKVIDFATGDVTGQLPYSRLGQVTGRSIVEEPLEVLHLPRELLDTFPIECPHLTATCVHVMLDRARVFKSSDLQVEKLASLGKLAAGLAHELNNPASAAVRGARLISDALAQADEASRTLRRAGVTDDEMSLLERLQSMCLASPSVGILSALERADREDGIAMWLEEHDVDDLSAEALTDTALTLDMLDELADALSPEKLALSLRWMVAGSTVRNLARDIERAASRIHDLVSAVKGFTYVDHAAVPEPVDLSTGLSDTIAVLAAKARAKSASLSIDVPTDLPRVRGIGGELNQIWANLVDNALDAIDVGGQIHVQARSEGPSVVVRVIDDGPGIPDDIKSRIFDPFFTTKPVGAGTGLGLDIVRRLVQQNNGLIDVHSEPGRTEFMISLPATS